MRTLLLSLCAICAVVTHVVSDDDCGNATVVKAFPSLPAEFEAVLRRSITDQPDRELRLYITESMSAVKVLGASEQQLYIDYKEQEETVSITGAKMVCSIHKTSAAGVQSLGGKVPFMTWTAEGVICKETDVDMHDVTADRFTFNLNDSTTVSMCFEKDKNTPLQFQTKTTDANDKVVQTTYDFLPGFRAGAVSDSSVFEVPFGVHCDSSTLEDRKTAPTITGPLTAELETRDPGSQLISHSSVAFAHDLSLSRYDKLCNDMTDTCTIIHDYNENVLIEYNISQVSGACVMKDLNDSSVAHPDGIYVNGTWRMDTAAQMLHMQDAPMTYQGMKHVRGVPCEVWAGDRTQGLHLVAFWAVPGYKSMSDGFVHPSPDKKARILIGYQIVDYNSTLDVSTLTQDTHVTGYAVTPIQIWWYDVQLCHTAPKQQLHARLQIKGSFKDIVTGNLLKLTQAMWRWLADTSGVSYVRVVMVEFYETSDDDVIDVWFTILDIANVPGKAETSMDDALDALKKALEDNDLDLPAPYRCCNLEKLTLKKASVKTDSDEPDPRPSGGGGSSGSSGYSSGSMAGLAFGMLLAGALLGVFIILFWQRRKNRQFGYRRDLDYTNM